MMPTKNDTTSGETTLRGLSIIRKLVTRRNMGPAKFNLLEFVKNITYKLVLPVYLWSIGFKTLESYCEDIYINESYARGLAPTTKEERSKYENNKT